MGVTSREWGLTQGLAAMALLCVSMTWSAQAQEIIHADAAFEGVPDGSALRPYQTITAALNVVVPGRGDTVLVAPGVYAEALIVPADTLLSSTDGAMATVLAPLVSVGPTVILAEASAIQGFRIASERSGIRVPLGVSADVLNCVIHDGERGVDVQSDASARIDNNTFYNNGVGVMVREDAAVSSLQNNIFALNGIGVELEGAAEVDNGYNAFWQNVGAAYLPAIPAESDIVRNPLFVNPLGGNFHLRALSTLRNAGNPAARFNNRDGSPNTIGSDGGPNGTLDILRPRISVSTVPAPPSGPAPLSVLFNAGDSADAFGIDSWEWDFDARDGISVEGFGPSVPVVFSQPGGYLVTLVVRDNTGFESRTQIPVRVGNAPELNVSVQPPAGKAPVEVQYVAQTEAPAPLELDWDVNGDGRIDSRTTSPRINWTEDEGLGLFTGNVLLADGLGRNVQLPLSFTLTRYEPEVIQTVQPGGAANIGLAIEGNPAEGARFILQSGSFGESFTLAMSGLALEDLPLDAPGGDPVAGLYVAPEGLRLARMATVELPLPAEADLEGLMVWWLNPANNEWQTRGIGRVRLDTTAGPVLQFETARLGVFAVTVNSFTLPPTCGCGGTGSGDAKSAFGDALILLLTLGALCVTVGRGRKERGVQS